MHIAPAVSKFFFWKVLLSFNFNFSIFSSGIFRWKVRFLPLKTISYPRKGKLNFFVIYGLYTLVLSRFNFKPTVDSLYPILCSQTFDLPNPQHIASSTYLTTLMLSPCFPSGLMQFSIMLQIVGDTTLP